MGWQDIYKRKMEESGLEAGEINFVDVDTFHQRERERWDADVAAGKIQTVTSSALSTPSAQQEAYIKEYQRQKNGGEAQSKFNGWKYFRNLGQTLLNGVAGLAASGAWAEDRVTDVVDTIFQGAGTHGSGLFNALYNGRPDWKVFGENGLIGIRQEQEALAQERADEIAKIKTGNADADTVLQDVASFGGDTAAALGGALPMAAEALLTGGAGMADDLIRAGTNVIGKTGILDSINATLKKTLTSREYWTAFATEVGQDYQEALADGATETEASNYAVSTALLNSVIEIGGGIQNVPENFSVKNLLRSAAEEGMEEVEQGPVGRLMKDVVYGKNAPVFSVTDENAVLNPKTAAQEFAGGFAVGGIMSGGQAAARSAINRVYQTQYEKAVQQAREKAGIKGDYQVSQNGKTAYNGQEVSVEGVDKDGKLRLSTGDTVSPADVEFSTQGTAEVYEGLANSDIPKAAQGVIAKAYESGDSFRYVLGAEEAYRAGQYGIGVENMSRNGFSADLTDAQRKLAYDMGASMRKAETSETSEKAAPVKSGKVVYEQGVDQDTFTPIQRGSVKLAEAITQAVNGEVHLYSTTQDAEGKRTIDQKDVAALLGSAENAPNGFYDHKTGNIYVDINAGSNGEGTILYTLGHEYTHLIRQNARESFDKLADYLFSQYGEQGVDVDALVLAKQEKLGVDYETAYEEVVADSMETMLTDTNAAEKIAALKKTDKTLWEKLKDLVSKLLESVRELYQNMAPNSEEGRMVRQMGDALDKLSDLFVEGLGNVQTVTETGEGRVLYQARSSKDSEVVSIKQQIAAAKTQLDSMEPVVHKDIPDSLSRMTFKQKRAWAEKEAQRYGSQVDRQNYGKIVINGADINSALNYLKEDGEIAAFSALPAVLKRGKEIYREADHKGRGYPSVTFAAPVVINGVRGNMAAIVRETSKNHYDMHRIVMPDGSVFTFTEKANAETGPATATPASGALTQPTVSASDNSISDSSGKSNTKISKQERDSAGRQLTEQQQEYFKDSKVRDAEGRLKPVYHGSSAQFTKFSADFMSKNGSSEGQGFYFTDLKTMAQGYEKSGGQLLEGYLDIKNPLSDSDVTLTNAEVKRLIMAIDPTGDDLVLNYDSRGGMGYPSRTWYNRAVNDTLRMTMETSESDSEILAELANGMGDPGAVLKAAREVLGYDGYIVEGKYDDATVYVAFDSSQFKNVDNPNPTTNPDIRLQQRDYSYAALTAKPNMPVTEVDDTMRYEANSISRKNIVARGIAAAKKVGGTNENGNAVIHVDDTDTDVILSAKGLRHGLDRRFSTNVPVTLKAGEILKNAVRINELTPKKDTVDASYVLIGAAKNAKNEPYIVQFVVNRASNEVTSVDVLYSIGTKTEPAGSLSPEVTGVPATLTGSTISISSLLDYVNRYFPDILPEDVLRHYGYEARPAGELGESALFQQRGTSDREILASTPENSAKTEWERKRLAEYKDAVGRLGEYEARLSANRAELAELSYTGEKKNAKRISQLRTEITQDTNRVAIVESRLKELEGNRSLNDLLGREKESIRAAQEQRMRELEARLNEYREKYGVFPGGEKAAREILLPKKSSDGKKISQTVRTILEAKSTPEEMVPDIETLALDGKYSYDMYSDKTAIADAGREIKRVGWAQALTDWKKAIKRGSVSKKNTAMGWALYNNAANSGDTETALSVLSDMVQHQRSAAQALQATRILKQLSPETQLYQAQRSIENLQTELNKEFGDNKAPKLKIDQELAEQFIKAADQAERDAILRNIYRDIGKQMPSRFKDKWNAWRYLAMLGNARTHVRNVLGNAGFAPVVAVKNTVATGIERAVYRLSGGKMARSKEFVLGKEGKALLQAAAQDYAKVADVAMGGGKYSDLANANKYIEEGRVIFQSERPVLKQISAGLEAARKKNSELLDLEDTWFSKPHYAYAMAQYCKANGITAEQIAKGGEDIVKAREYAILEAQKATYRDTNTFSQTISELGRMGKTSGNGTKKVVSTLMEGILPFRKTPANILVRGVEYSPIGLLNGIKEAVFDVRNGTKTAAEAIDSISAGLTGTGLMVLGVFLAAQGLVRGHGSDDDDKNEYAELTGHQAYALELPDGTSITLDWLAPECLPFFIGANLWELTDGGEKPLTMANVLDAVTQVSEPLLEMSCLQSLNAVFDAVGYAKSNGMAALPTALANAAASYMTQALPTLLGQLERVREDIRYTTFTEKDSFLTTDMQYTLGRASAKIPGVDYHQIPYIDAWGRREATGSVGKRAANNLLNPAYVSRVAESDMERELLRLYDVTGDGGVFPSRAGKSFTVNGTQINLSAEDYVKYAEAKGGEAYRLLTTLTQSSAYRSMTDEQKKHCVLDIYDYANQTAKTAVSDFEPDTWVAESKQSGTVLDKVEERALYEGKSAASIAKYKEYGNGIDKDTFFTAWSKIWSTTGEDYDGDGKSDAYSKVDKQLKYINTLSLTTAQKRALALACGISEKTLDKRAPW